MACGAAEKGEAGCTGWPGGALTIELPRKRGGGA